MEPIERIKHCRNSEKLSLITRELIRKAEKNVMKINRCRGLIGTKLDINQKEFNLGEVQKDKDEFGVYNWNGFIPKDTKIVYGVDINPQFDSISHGGFYYYADDYSYIYEFIELMKKYKIYEFDEIIVAINDFIKLMFDDGFERRSKWELDKLFFKNDFQYFEPTKEHSIRNYYRKGSAECSELALIANNILSVLGIPVTYCLNEDHAFNIVYKLNEHNDYDGFILDYSHAVSLYNINLEYIGCLPFFRKIEGGEKEIFEMLHNGKKLHFYNYDAIRFNSVFELDRNEERTYCVYYDPPEGKKKIIIKER